MYGLPPFYRFSYSLLHSTATCDIYIYCHTLTHAWHNNHFKIPFVEFFRSVFRIKLLKSDDPVVSLSWSFSSVVNILSVSLLLKACHVVDGTELILVCFPVVQ